MDGEEKSVTHMQVTWAYPKHVPAAHAPVLDIIFYKRHGHVVVCRTDVLKRLLEPPGEPGVVHVGLPSGLHDRSGQGRFLDSDQAILRHAVSVLKEQERKGRFGSLGGPVGSAIFHGKELVELCGSLSEPRRPWSGIRTDACQYGWVAEDGELWLSNMDLSSCSLRCRRPDSLAPTVHPHRATRGSSEVRSDDRKEHWAGAGDKEAVRPSGFCDAYWSSAEVALRVP